MSPRGEPEVSSVEFEYDGKVLYNLFSCWAVGIRQIYKKDSGRFRYHNILSDLSMTRQYLCLLFVLALMLLQVPTRGQEALSITLTTDKQNYDLGQAVLFTVRVQQSGAPVASVVVFFELRGPQNQVIVNGFGITDSTGKYSRQIMIRNDFPLGAYTVYVGVTANGQSASATAVFQTIPEFVSGSMLVQVFAFVIAISMLRLYGKRRFSDNVSASSSL